jgi:hypothetical protein
MARTLIHTNCRTPPYGNPQRFAAPVGVHGATFVAAETNHLGKPMLTHMASSADLYNAQNLHEFVGDWDKAGYRAGIDRVWVTAVYDQP